MKRSLIEAERIFDLYTIRPPLNEDKDFAKCVYEADGSLVQIQSRATTFINSGLNIRQDWLDELGMDTPTTVKELTEFLLTCKNQYGLTNAFEMVADLNCSMNRSSVDAYNHSYIEYLAKDS